jgi:hypothetical protein
VRIKQVKLYTYSELSDKAKERARDWYREVGAGDPFYIEHVTEDFHETLKALGFDVMQRRGNYLDPRDPRAVRSTVEWSGFSSQGDGASFSGTWRASDCDPVALLEDRPQVFATPNGENATSKENVELHRITSEILECKKAGLSHACIESRRFHMSLNGTGWDDQPDTATADEWEDHCEVTEARFIEACRDLAHAFYKALEAEYEYQNADEQVAESIEANGYEFTEDGERA